MIQNDDKKEEVTLQDLQDFAKMDLGRRGMLTKMFSGNVRGTLAQAAIKNKMAPSKASPRFDGGRASMRFERALKKNGKTQMASRRESQNLRDLRVKHRGNERAVQMEVREQQRNRKRKLNAVATTNTMADLVIQTGMDLQQLMSLREDFADLIARKHENSKSKAKGSVKNAITLEQLTDVLFSRFPDLEDGKAFRRALAVFDVDGDGFIDFDEFILALKRMDKDDDPTKNLEFIFDMFDESRDGEVELWEVSDAIEDHRKDIEDMHKYCKGLAQSLDIDGDGHINMNEFRGSLKKEKVFINFCYEGLAPVHPTTNACIKTISEFKARAMDAADPGGETPRNGKSSAPIAPVLRPDGKVIKPKVSPESVDLAVTSLFDGLLENFESFTSIDELTVESSYDHLAESWSLPPRGDEHDAECYNTYAKLFHLVESEDGEADGLAKSAALWTALTKSLTTICNARPETALAMKATMLFKLIQSGHEKHNPGAIHIDVCAEENVSVEQVQGHLDRMKNQLTEDMEYLLLNFDEWDKDGSGSVTQDELIEYVMQEPRVMRMLQCVFFL